MQWGWDGDGLAPLIDRVATAVGRAERCVGCVGCAGVFSRRLRVGG